MAILRSDHPRLWLTPSSLAALQARAKAGDPSWLACKAVADRAIDWDSGLYNACYAYQMTGDPTYAQKAWSLLSQSLTAGVNQVTRDSYYDARSFFPGASMCYDYLYNWMSPTQRAQLQASMELCADAIWPETAPARLHQWAVDPDASMNNYHFGFLLTWLAGLVLGSDSAKSVGYIAQARRRWDTEITPLLATWVQGGMFNEGMSYGIASGGFMFWNLLAVLSTTGEDLISATPFCREMVTAILHLTTPSMAEKAPFGDLAAGPLNDYTRRVMLCMSGHDPRCRPYLDSITPNHNQQRLTQWEECLFGNPPVPGPTGEPTYFFAPGTHVVSSRTDWSTSATQLLVKAGPVRESHEDRAVGTFYLWRNGWQAATEKLGSHSGIVQDAWQHCCLSVENGGIQQSQTWTQAGAGITVQEDTPNLYTYLEADLTAAYPGLSAYLREYFFLKSGSFLLVRDAYVPVSPASVIQANVSTLAAPTADLIGFRAGSLFGKPLWPNPGSLTFAPVQNNAQDTVTYRTSLTGDATNEIILALEAGAPGQTVTTLQQVVSTPGLKGVLMTGSFAGWGTGPGPWSFTAPAMLSCWVMGLKPNTVYNVPPMSTSTTSPAGVLFFTAPPGSVVISEAGIIPPPPVITITGCSPNPATSGQQVTVTGTNFTAGMNLSWGAIPIPTFVLSGPNTLFFTAPAVTTPTANVLYLRTVGGQTVIGPALTVNPVVIPPPAPTISGCTPNPVTSGQQVTVAGTGFNSAMYLTWGPLSISTFVLTGTTLLTFTAPAVTVSTTGVLAIASGGQTVTGPALTVNPVVVPPGPTTYTLSGVVTENPDGTMTGPIKVVPNP